MAVIDTSTDHDGRTDRTDQDVWQPWRAVEGSGFVVRSAEGGVGLEQLDPTEFAVTTEFRFADPDVLGDLRQWLVRHGVDPHEAAERIEDARRVPVFEEDDQATDAASIPWFMRWFENTYGRHTLAAIVHDRLIVAEPNGGALGSDVLADRFFREMMRCSGVALLKRWIMWAAVALRTRYVAGGWRRLTVVVWLVLAVAGMTALGCGIWGLVTGGEVLGVDAAAAFVASIVLPFVSAPLWGSQWGAGLVAAATAPWLLPPALIAAIGRGVHWVLERVLAPFDRRRGPSAVEASGPTHGATR